MVKTILKLVGGVILLIVFVAGGLTILDKTGILGSIWAPPNNVPHVVRVPSVIAASKIDSRPFLGGGEYITMTTAVQTGLPDEGLSPIEPIRVWQVATYVLIGTKDTCVLRTHFSYEVLPSAVATDSVRFADGILTIRIDGDPRAVPSGGADIIKFYGNCEHWKGWIPTIFAPAESADYEDLKRDLMSEDVTQKSCKYYQGKSWASLQDGEMSDEEIARLAERKPKATEAKIRALKQYAGYLAQVLDPLFKDPELGLPELKGIRIIAPDALGADGRPLALPDYWTITDLLTELGKITDPSDGFVEKNP